MFHETMTKCDDPNFLHGQWLASPLPGDEVVISGMAGEFPNCNDIYEFLEKLETKTDMVDADDRRWNLNHPLIPARAGKLNTIDRLDCGFFGLHYQEGTGMDASLRILLEKTVEAVLDAGINLRDLEGTKTGVFCALALNEGKATSKKLPNGISTSFFAHRLSYFLKLKGSSFCVDTACSSASYALDNAFRSIRMGKCENAIVAASHLTLNPGATAQFFSLGVLNQEGTCKSFDEDANGYVRSETVGAIFLQKAKNSKRIYAKIINTKINNDGFKDTGITFPSTVAQQKLLSEIYSESQISPDQISYLEGHATGTTVGDPEEIAAVDLALAKHRTKPLLIGGVKSSIGHAEAPSGMASLVKILLAMETNKITPNIHLKTVNKKLKGIIEGRMKVVTELTDIHDENPIMGLNNFGFGGSNAHIILQRVSKPHNPEPVPKNKMPQLVCVGGRTQEAVTTLLNYIYKQNGNRDYLLLLSQIYKSNIKEYIYRGYAIFNNNKPFNIVCKLSKKTPPLYLCFGNFEIGAMKLGKELLQVEIFRSTINKIDQTANLDVYEALKNNCLEKEKLVSFAVQLSLLVLFQELNLKIEAVYGDGLGKLVASFHYELITFQEAVFRAMAIITERKMSEKRENRLDTITNFELSSKNKSMYNNATMDKNSQSFFITEDFYQIGKKSIVLDFSDMSCKANTWKLTDRTSLLETLGRLYTEGFTVSYDKLFDKFVYPVGRATSMISPLVKWNHKRALKTYRFESFSKQTLNTHLVDLSYFNEEDMYIAGHVIDGRNLIPATKYLDIVWEHFAALTQRTFNFTPVVIEDCKFIKAAIMPSNAYISLEICIEQATGKFEISEKNSLLVSGKISDLNNRNNIKKEKEIKDSKENMLQQDEIYRELYLRGYNYTGLFQGLTCNVEGTYGMVKWDDNWTAYMDKMLQLKILQADTRLLFVPISIEKLVIDPIEHLKAVGIEKNKNNNKEKPETEAEWMPVYADKHTDIIRSGGIAIKGVRVKSIAKKRQPLEPVLEKNEFVPNKSEMDLAKILRVNTQIIIENSMETNFKALELFDNDTKADAHLLLPIINDALADVPIVNPILTISTKHNLEDIPGITIENVDLNASSNFLLIAGTHILKKPNFPTLLNCLNDNGYILTRENLNFEWENCSSSIELFTEYTTKKEKLLLFKKRQSQPYKTEYVEIDEEYKWLASVKNALLKKENNVALYASNTQPNGILGLVNCLRREPNGNRIQCFFSLDNSFNFDFKKQNTEMAINIFKDGRKGTYRHLLIENNKKVQTAHRFATNSVMGNLSSLEWVEGPLTVNTPTAENNKLIFTYYSSLNFKDIVVASARVGPEVFTTNRLRQISMLGIEFSGKTSLGKKVGGIVLDSAISTMVHGDSDFMLYFDDRWSLKEIASIPVVYSTVICGLLMIAKIKKKSSILIHSGTGGIGLAAINVCGYFDCNIFVTVGSQEKRNYIRENYPHIKENHIGNSRDTSFEQMIQAETNGRGVDIVLNSLSDEKLHTSMRCLARGGHFIEIGKFDLANNTSLKLLCDDKEVNYYGVMLDQFSSKALKQQTMRLVQAGIDAGYVKPLPTTVFKSDELEKAFRYMTTGKHIGKVLIEIRSEKDEIVDYQNQTFEATPRFNCDVTKSYVIVGGLGGIGLELADWLVTRGAKNLILSSRKGIRTNYQVQRIKIWESYGVAVTVSTSNVATKEGCLELINIAQKLGPVDAVFNLAVVLEDELFENQTKKSFEASFAPKVYTTKHLDYLTRKMCLDLRYFVVFSSVSCGRGNIGQTNYGMANSIMERICERRNMDGYPALAIQWGAVGDVGLVAKMQKENKELVIGGTLQQKISSCFEVLDKFLKQKNAIVSSMIVATKSNKSFGSLSLVDVVAKIIGIKNIKTVSQYSTLAELGVDSMMGTELVKTLEKDFDIFITSNELKSLTLSRLEEIEAERTASDRKDASDHKLLDKVTQATDFFIQFIPEHSDQTVPKVRCLPSAIPDGQKASSLIIFPGIEGVLNLLEPLAKNVNASVYGVEYSSQDSDVSIENTAKYIFELLQPILKNDNNITIAAHSYGVLIAVEVIHLIEKNHLKAKFIAIDSSPKYLQTIVENRFSTNEAEFQTLFLIVLLKEFISLEQIDNNKEKLLQCETLEERIEAGLALVPPIAKKMNKLGLKIIYRRLKQLMVYKFAHNKLKSDVHLIKAKCPMMEFKDDYNLSEIFEQLGSITTLEGDHSSVLKETSLQNFINNIIET